jgi:hypothetical protein
MRHSREKRQSLMALVPQSAISMRETVSPASRIVESATPQLIHRLSAMGESDLEDRKGDRL